MLSGRRSGEEACGAILGNGLYIGKFMLVFNSVVWFLIIIFLFALLEKGKI